jgi:hypothetical protein
MRNRRLTIVEPAAAENDRDADRILVGVIVSVLDARRVQVTVSRGETVEAVLPKHVEASWLEAALAVAPVEAGILEQGERCLVWAIYPGPEHAEVRAEELRLDAHKIVLEAGRARLELAEDQLRIKASEVQSRATGEHWIMGARIRLN